MGRIFMANVTAKSGKKETNNGKKENEQWEKEKQTIEKKGNGQLEITKNGKKRNRQRNIGRNIRELGMKCENKPVKTII